MKKTAVAFCTAVILRRITTFPRLINRNQARPGEAVRARFPAVCYSVRMGSFFVPFFGWMFGWQSVVFLLSL